MNVKQKEGESNAAFFARNVGMAAFSACVAESLTIPMDTAKVRLQLQKTAEGEKPRYAGLFGTAKTIAAEEGVTALFGGLMPGLQRQVLFAGLRVGLYIPIRNMITGPLKEGEYPSLLQKIATAMISGTLAISVANPTDLVKIKMQAQGIGIINGIPP
jgi:solute carrier family 25 uncoupling protein 8/9